MPFYPSPNRDDGYDSTDYSAVDPSLGSLGDLVAFVRTAKDRGMRIIVDLVVNHTSDQHPWFRSARRSKDSPHRAWYVRVEDEPEQPHAEVDRKSVVSGKSVSVRVDLGGRRIIKKKNKNNEK